MSNRGMNRENSSIYEGIGLMSGTSMDGIDLAYCRFAERIDPGLKMTCNDAHWSFEILKAETIPMPETWHGRLDSLGEQSAETFARTHVRFGHFLGETLRDFIHSENIKPQFVSSHGHTVFHQPSRNFSVQIGDGETLATYLNMPLVTQFRQKDVALGGEGAPLVPFGEQHLFPKGMLFMNLGGIVNLSIDAMGFDICVCNMALNRLAGLLDPPAAYDAGGAIAASSQVDPTLLNALDGLPWYELPPPKSLGKEWFETWVIPLLKASNATVRSQMATYTEHIANKVASAVLQTVNRCKTKALMSPTAILMSGGGVHNDYLVARIRQKMSDAGLNLDILTDPSLIDHKEAMIFAFLGLQVLLGRSNVLASVTGARQDSIGGSIHLPSHMEHFQLPLQCRHVKT